MTNQQGAPLPSNEAERLKALAEYEILDTEAERHYDDITFIASTICGVPISTMTLIDKERQWFKAKVGITSTESPREQAFCGFTILQTVPLVVADAQKDERFAKNPLVTGDPKIRFYAGVPLINPQGFALGALCVIDRKPRTLDATQTRALEALGRQIISQLELRRTTTHLIEEMSRVKTLHGLLPICSFCKGIRNDKGYWVKVEDYIKSHSDASFTHGICEKCGEKHYPELYKTMKNAKQ